MFGQAACAGEAARAPVASAGHTARRLRGEMRAPPPGAAEPGQAAQAGVRSRPGALPELRRRAEGHSGDPVATGDRVGSHTPGIARAGAASCAGPWPDAASRARTLIVQWIGRAWQAVGPLARRAPMGRLKNLCLNPARGVLLCVHRGAFARLCPPARPGHHFAPPVSDRSQVRRG